MARFSSSYISTEVYHEAGRARTALFSVTGLAAGVEEPPRPKYRFKNDWAIVNVIVCEREEEEEKLLDILMKSEDVKTRDKDSKSYIKVLLVGMVEYCLLMMMIIRLRLDLDVF
jgi:hypothetical protein